jgi:hypothetical protein
MTTNWTVTMTVTRTYEKPEVQRARIEAISLAPLPPMSGLTLLAGPTVVEVTDDSLQVDVTVVADEMFVLTYPTEALQKAVLRDLFRRQVEARSQSPVLSADALAS